MRIAAHEAIKAKGLEMINYGGFKEELAEELRGLLEESPDFEDVLIYGR